MLHSLVRQTSGYRGPTGGRSPPDNREMGSGQGEGVFDFSYALLVPFRMGQSWYAADMRALSIWVSPKDLVWGLGEASRSYPMDARPPWHCFLNSGTLVIGKPGPVLVCTDCF